MMQEDINNGYYALLACILHKDLSADRAFKLMKINVRGEDTSSK